MTVKQAYEIAWVGPVPSEFFNGGRRGKAFRLPWCIGWHEVKGMLVEEVEDDECLICNRPTASSVRHICPTCGNTFVCAIKNFPYQLECRKCDPE